MNFRAILYGQKFTLAVLAALFLSLQIDAQKTSDPGVGEKKQRDKLDATITETNGNRTRMMIYEFKEKEVVTSSGSIPFEFIHEIRFNRDPELDSPTIEKLTAAGITVYVDEVKFSALSPNRLGNEAVKPIVFGDPYSFLNLGFGYGLDYGGIGTRITVMPFNYVSILFGSGYAVHGIGVNGGLILSALPKKRVCPTITAMYGYNALTSADYPPPSGVPPAKTYREYNKLYYGATFGAGLKIRIGFANCITASALYPLRSSEYESNLSTIKQLAGVSLNETGTILFSLGVHFAVH